MHIFGVTSVIMKYSETEIAYLKENYSTLGASRCGRHLGRSIESLRRIAKGLGLPAPGKYVKENHERNVNPEHFYNVVMPEVAYFLGYFWADGYIHYYKSGKIVYHRIAIEVERSDGEHLRKIAQTFGKWSAQERSRKRYGIDMKPTMTLAINNPPLYQFLFEHGYDEKSVISPTKIVNHIPESLRPAFWLGFFDGDGWVLEDRAGLGFAGSYEQDWSALCDLFKRLEIHYAVYPYISPSGHKSSSVVVQSRAGVSAFYNYISSFAYLGLTRKQERFRAFMNLLGGLPES